MMRAASILVGAVLLLLAGQSAPWRGSAPLLEPAPRRGRAWTGTFDRYLASPRRPGSGARQFIAYERAPEESGATRRSDAPEMTDAPGAALPQRGGDSGEGAGADAAVPSRFAYVDAYVDSKNQPLAAYQFELTAQGAGVTLVGVEGGDPGAYAEPPYYDPKANLQNRIVIAAFNTGDDLPKGRRRVARVMVRVTGATPPTWSAKLDVAAGSDAKPIDATIQVIEGAAQ